MAGEGIASVKRPHIWLLGTFALVLALSVLAGLKSGSRNSTADDDAWRWESFSGAEVRVPKGFGWSGTDQAFGQWCVGRNRDGLVARPGGISTLVGCGGYEQDSVELSETLAKTGPVVAFKFGARPPGMPHRTILKHGNLSVVVQAKDPLRTMIANSVRFVDHEDWAGCPIKDSISRNLYASPRPATDVTKLRGVDRVAVCKYDKLTVDKPGLSASNLLKGVDARQTVRAIARAPKGTGPNQPETCIGGDALEAIVLRVHSRSGLSRIHVRYDDCDNVGFDDGVATRELTKNGLAHVLVGSLHPDGWSGHLDAVFPNR